MNLTEKGFLLILLSSIVIFKFIPSNSPQILYDYYDLSLQKCNSKGNYTIHGLWPEFNGTSWPAFCRANDNLDKKQIEGLIDQLNEDWCGCSLQLEFSFWAHEWSKHGTCTGLSQFEYFNRTLSLFKLAKETNLINDHCMNSTMTGNQCFLRVNLDWKFADSEKYLA